MGDLASMIMFGFLFAALISVGVDLQSYEARQLMWERTHPGKTYIRHYRALKAKGLIDDQA